MRKIIFSLILILAFASGCGNGGGSGSTPSTSTDTTTTKTVPISIKIDNLQKPIGVNVVTKNKPSSSIKITISAPDITTIDKVVQVNGISVNSAGNVYVADKNNNRIQKFIYQ